MPKISIIVTAYNIERYIQQCLESIAGQSLSDFEVFVVDDGSTDKTPRLIAEFAESDPRFVPVLLPENSPGGVGTAANAGLDRATAEWVGFVDGDDYVEPNMFETLVEAAQLKSADLAMCQYLEVSDDGTDSREPADATRWDEIDRGYHTLTTANKKKLLRFIAVPWRKLYRRSLLESNGIRFPTGDFFYEDNPFHWLSIISADSIVLVDEVLCYHRIGRVGQTMSAADSKLFKMFRHHDIIHAWLVKVGLRDEYGSSLLEWAISQAEWISQRTPKALRVELYTTLRGVFEQYSVEVLEKALRDGRKGPRAQQLCRSVITGNLPRFLQLLSDGADRNNYVRLAYYHLQYTGVGKTLQMTVETVRNRIHPRELAAKISTRVPKKARHTPSNEDVMLGLSVLQGRLDRIDRKLDAMEKRGTEEDA